MDKTTAIDAVRILVQEGEIDAINAYARLEPWCSGSEIDALFREWEQERVLCACVDQMRKVLATLGILPGDRWYHLGRVLARVSDKPRS
jgi:hypothetical protein